MTTRNHYHSPAGMRRVATLVLLIGMAVLGPGCDSGMTDDPIPYVPFDEIVINLNLPSYATLRTNGGYVNIDGGVRGIILYRQDANTYIAFERNCSYRPNEACATVDVHSSTLFMTDACCNSTFTFPEGQPNGGPAWRPLMQYRTILQGNQLTITDEVL